MANLELKESIEINGISDTDYKICSPDNMKLINIAHKKTLKKSQSLNFTNFPITPKEDSNKFTIYGPEQIQSIIKIQSACRGWLVRRRIETIEETLRVFFRLYI